MADRRIGQAGAADSRSKGFGSAGAGADLDHSARRPLLLSLIALFVFFFAAALALGFGYGVRDAAGEHSAAQPAAAGPPSPQETKEALESPDTEILEEAPEADLQAARELPHRDLERPEALELTEAVFSSELETADGIVGELEPTKFLSNYAAIVSGPELPEPAGQDIGQPQEGTAPSGSVLVESTLPLRTANEAGKVEAVDLSLKPAEGELEAQNPLTQIGIPAELGDGLTLQAPEIQIEVAGAPDGLTPTNVDGEYAFYPNVSKDTDFVIAPTPTGVETFTTIRSHEAERSTTYHLSIAYDDSLRARPDGGAEVVRNGQAIVVIPPPIATDAAGEQVPADLQVHGNQLTVEISPEEGTAYPILVDPEYIVEGWRWQIQHDHKIGWSCNSTYSYTPSSPAGSYRCYGFQHWNPASWWGLVLSSGFGPAVSGTHIDWEYWVPRYREDISNPAIGTPPTTWVYQLYTEGVLFYPWGESRDYPALVIGLVDPNYGWAVSGVHYGGQGEMNNWGNSFTFTNEYPTGSPHQTNTKGADMNLVTYQAEYPSVRRDTYIATAAIAVVDDEPPQVLKLNPPEKWATGSYETIPYAFEDRGLGVRSAGIKPAGQPSWVWWMDFGCSGTNAAPCPRVANSNEAGRPALAYAPNQLPTGRNKLEVTVGDPLWTGAPAHSVTGNVVVKVDNTAPELSLAGSLTEQGVLGTQRPEYSLRVNANDGTEAAPQSGIAKVELRVDGQRIAMPEESEWAPNCQTQSCSFSGDWRLSASDFAPGRHEVQVIATDAVGLTTTKALAIDLRPPAPSLSLSGTITEQATLGMSRPQYKLKVEARSLTESPIPGNTPSSPWAFGSPGTAQGQFNHPGDVAIGPVGTVWVVDTNNNRVQRFNSSGGNIGAPIGSIGSGNGQFKRPTAIAFGPDGHFWITDSGNKRVQEFSQSGQYLGKFGGPGTGNGQFAGSGPEGIAIDYHGNVWVSDTYGARIQKFNENGEFLRAFGTRGLGVGQFIEPTGIEVGPGGNIWVTDWGKNKVLEFTSGGQLLREFGGEGSGNGEFRHPGGIAIDSKGDVWVGDQNNQRIQQFNQAGEFIGKFGSAGTGSGQFNLGYPIGLATDTAGRIWLTDTGNNRVQKWTIPGYTTRPGPSFFRSIGTAGTGNGQFTEPTDVAADSKGNFWVVEYGRNRIQKFNENNGEYLFKLGSLGSGNSQFNHPLMVTVDAKDRVLVSDTSNHRIQVFSESGTFVRKFGSFGSGPGQLNEPAGIAVDPKGQIWVADAKNNRIQVFSESGGFIRAVGSSGSGPGQLSHPNGIAATPEGNIWVVDHGNNRLVEFSDTGGFIREAGSVGSGVGQYQGPTDVTIDSNGHLWVIDQGNQRIQQLTPTGEFIRQFGSFGAGPESVSWPYGIDTDVKGHVLIADWGNSRIDEWNQQALHSQVSIEITVDGKRVDTAATSCAAETCPAQSEWILESSGFPAGIHRVAVRVTDGLGNTTTKMLNIETQRDATKPDLNVGGELASAPEGWVEQEGYGIHASATDAGYGVTSLAFKLDGQTIASVTQACQNGACPATLSDGVNMSDYEGGAHHAEILARDGAGNLTTKSWTINVNPGGQISTGEAEATLEAMEATSPVNAVGPAQEEELEGTAAGLEIAPAEETGTSENGIDAAFEAVGTNVPMAIGVRPEYGAEYHVLPEYDLLVPCPDSTDVSTPPSEEEVEEPSEPESPAPPSCVPLAVLEAAARAQEDEVASGAKHPGLQPITVSPVTIAGSAEVTSSVNGAAVVATDTAQSVDTVTRPLLDGGLTFQTIRGSAAPEHYAFEMDLSSELELRQINPREVAVFYKEGFPAFTIAAIPAHDAIGSTVPTQLTKTGADIITLTVGHRGASPAGGSFVYPVIGGAGWEGGFRTISVELDEPEPENEEELEGIDGEDEGTVLWRRSISAPIPIATDSLPQLLRDPLNIPAREKNFRFERCTWTPVSGDLKVGPPPKFRELVRRKEWECTGTYVHEEGGNATVMKPREAIMMRGSFGYKRNSRVWLQTGPACFQWGQDQPHQIRCYADRAESREHINLFGQWRYDPATYVGQQGSSPVCFEINPTLSPNPPKQENGAQYLNEILHWSWGPRAWRSECNWHDLMYKH